MAAQERLAKKRRSREVAAGVNQSEMYDPVGDRLQEWRQYVGDYAPLIMISVEPKIGETSGSAVLNLLGAFAAGYTGTAYYGSHMYEYNRH